MSIVYRLLCVLSLTIYLTSCADPSKEAASESAGQANNTDSSSSNTEFDRDTTVNINSGAGVGLPVGEGDSLEKSGNTSGH